MFRFLHASDLHIAERPEQIGVSDLRLAGLRRWLHKPALASSYEIGLSEAFARLAATLAGGDAGIDAVLLSGDLATTGGLKDLETAFAFVDGDVKPGLFETGESLRSCGKQRLVIPGNHDRFEPPHLLPGGTNFDHIFGAFWNAGQGVQTLWQGERDGEAFALIGADLTLRNEADATIPGIGHLGQGWARTAVIDALVAETARVRAEFEQIGIVWAVHFPPEFSGLSGLLELIEGSRLVNAAAASGVQHVLTGHTHSPRIYDCAAVDGQSVRIFCAGTATQAISSTGHNAHLLEFGVGGSGVVFANRLDLHFDPEEGEFVPVS